ncbi:hypothetical protein SLS55_010382 [Diplodia seriata]|uniref:NACHT domain-containing protein n=1 Tax=Diplodia seriata TaxID=420778 RepID=A0ABR3BYC9_9PEZI
MGDPLSVAASIAGLVALADIVFVRAFKYAKEAKGANQEISALANELQSLSGVLHSLHLRISGLGNDEQAHTATYRSDLVDSCIRLLVTVRDKLQEHKPGEQEQGPSRSLRKLKWPFSAKETKSLITDIERHKSTLTMALSADSMVAAQRILSSQEKLLSDVDEIKTDLKRRRTFESNLNDFVMSATLGEKQKEVLRFFGTVDPTERHQTSVSLRHPNTGLWLLESDEVQEWLNDSSARLWLSGIPGAGKTVLASAVIEAAVEQCCLDPDKGLAYFYCDYKDEQSQELTKILGSLAAQLARQNNESFQVLEKYYDALNFPGKPSVSSAKPSLIHVLQNMSTYFSEVFIVIDALDECGQNVTAVTESLACLNAKDGCNIKTLLLSRDEYAIRCCLQDEFTHVSIAARNHDLKLYVASQIETRMSSGRLRIRNPALKDEIMEGLVNGSKGMFRWAACQIDRLCRLSTDKARRNALNDLPPDLDSTYDRILICINKEDEGSRVLVQNTLRWIVFATVPLSTEQLREALSIEAGAAALDPDNLPDEESILDLCSSFIRKSVNGDRLELSHFTVEEYLRSSRIASNSDLAAYHIDSAASTLILSQNCLAYLNMQDFDQDVPSTLEAWKDRHKVYPFRIHAVKYWHRYATDQGSHFEDDLFFGLCQKLFHPDKSMNFLGYAQDALVGSIYNALGQTSIELTALGKLLFTFVVRSETLKLSSYLSAKEEM